MCKGQYKQWIYSCNIEHKFERSMDLKAELKFKLEFGL